MKQDNTITNTTRIDNYFSDALKWYQEKHLSPFFHRSCLIILLIIIIFVLMILLITIASIFPTTKQIRYVMESNNIAKRSSQITKIYPIDNSLNKGIANIFIKNFVIAYESYNYNNLKQQYAYLQNNSSRIVFRDFTNFMSIESGLSPIAKYLDKSIRKVYILKVTFLNDLEAIVEFKTIATKNTKEVIEDITWEAKLQYELDNITLNLLNKSVFHFSVTNYQIKMITNNLNNT